MIMHLNLCNDILLRHGFLSVDIDDLGVSIISYSVVIDMLCVSMVTHGADMDICILDHFYVLFISSLMMPCIFF